MTESEPIASIKCLIITFLLAPMLLYVKHLGLSPGARARKLLGPNALGEDSLL